MTKLSNAKIKWLIRQVVRHGRKPSEVAPVYGVTPRRVCQLVEEYKMTGMMPTLNPNRRPKTELSGQQLKQIDEAFEQTRLSPRLLFHELKRRGTPVPKNKMYVYLKGKRLVVPDPKKQKKRKRCRYERAHSGSLVHGDWHRTSESHPHCIIWLDDASRRILSGAEYGRTSTELSLETFRQAELEAESYNVFIREANTDRGSEFFAKGASKFKLYIESKGIRHVVSRRNNPQTNGKLERLWLEYDRHRWRFPSFDEWKAWYNNRLHGALNLEWGERPNEAFVRKMPPEAMLGLFFRIFKRKGGL